MVVVPRVEIAPGVLMPLISFGSQNNHTVALDLGARGFDTALVYGDKQQREIGEAVKKAVAHGVQRSELFVATKIPCCPGSAFINSCAGTAGEFQFCGQTNGLGAMFRKHVRLV